MNKNHFLVNKIKFKHLSSNRIVLNKNKKKHLKIYLKVNKIKSFVE